MNHEIQSEAFTSSDMSSSHRKPKCMNQAISLVIVVYEKELSELIFLLKSIELFFEIKSLALIYIAVQGQPHLCGVIENLINDNVPELSPLIELIPQADILGIGANGHGWYVQQILKLKVASIVKSEFALILDCKNHFVNKTSSDIFFKMGAPLYSLTDETRTLARTDSTLGSCFVRAHEIFELDYSQYIEYSLGPKTPFLFNRSYVTDMLIWLERKYYKNFADLFLNDLGTSEFYLYAAYLRHTGRFDSSVAFRTDKISLLIWESNVDDLVYIEYIQSLVDKEELKLFGIHKNAYGKISPNVMNTVSKIWDSRAMEANVCGYLSKVNGFDDTPYK